MRNVVIAGSTGLVGQALVRQLAGRGDVRVVALVRKAGKLGDASGVREQLFDFTASGAYESLGTPALPCDILLCALGTTRKQAGSKAAFQATDRDLPLRLAARLTAANPNAVFGLVSAVGADRPLGLYLHTKAEVEAGLQALGLAHVVVRPSLLLGERGASRPGEQLAASVMPGLFRLADALHLTRAPLLQRLRPVTAERVAAALIAATLDGPVSGRVVVEGEALAGRQ